MTAYLMFPKPSMLMAPPFTCEVAMLKVRILEHAWNSRDPERVARAFSNDSIWHDNNVRAFGGNEIRSFLTDLWSQQLDQRIVMTLMSFKENRIKLRFLSEWRDSCGQWHQSCGNENLVVDEWGLIKFRHAYINEELISDSDRRFLWPAPGPCPARLRHSLASDALASNSGTLTPVPR